MVKREDGRRQCILTIEAYQIELVYRREKKEDKAVIIADAPNDEEEKKRNVNKNKIAKRKEESSKSLAKEAPILQAKSSNKNLKQNPVSHDSCDDLVEITPSETLIENAQESVNYKISINTLSCKPCSILF